MGEMGEMGGNENYIMESIVEFFQGHPLVAVFLTVGIGFWLGQIRVKGFAVGAVAATLIVGVVVGQMKIVIPDMVKTIFFLFFLFAIGYSVGPQFFRSMRGPGWKQVVFAVTEALICAGTIWGVAVLMGYNKGIATGLYAGSQTASACLGMVGDTVREMPLDEEQRQYLLMIIPACYAVTYVFGTVGSAWYMSVIGPKFFGGLDKLKEEAATIEQNMDGGGATILSPGEIRAGRPVEFRVVRALGDYYSGRRTVKEIEDKFGSSESQIIIERIRKGGAEGKIEEAGPDSIVENGDLIAVGGRRRSIVEVCPRLGEEVVDPEMLNFAPQKTPVTVSHTGAGLTLGTMRENGTLEGVLIADIRRSGLRIPVRKQTELMPGDVITLVGFPRDVTAAAHKIGYADRQTNVTDMVFVGLGIAAGCLLGSLSVNIKGIPLSLGMSVGVLIAGLILGWWRNKKPSFGRIPAPAVWLMNNLGITMFIAVIGITAGAHFLHGLQEAGLWIFLVGGICTLFTLTVSILLAKKVFKFSGPETLGCVSGGRCAVAAIGAVTDRLQSDVPNLGYTVTYATANVALVFSSLIVLFLV